MREPTERLARELGHDFSDPGLLEQALTHRSAHSRHNERLEFLGDAVLNLIAAEILYERFPGSREGELTRLRARLVRRESLAVLARTLQLGSYLKLGAGELKSGGRDRDSILADAFEAVIGAIYEDSNLAACREFLLRAAADMLDGLESGAADKDPKTQLQEWLQSRQMALPVYSVSEVSGDGHEHAFTVECHLSDMDHTSVGHGANRRGAEQQAAARALQALSVTRSITVGSND